MAPASSLQPVGDSPFCGEGDAMCNHLLRNSPRKPNHKDFLMSPSRSSQILPLNRGRTMVAQPPAAPATETSSLRGSRPQLDAPQSCSAETGGVDMPTSNRTSFMSTSSRQSWAPALRSSAWSRAAWTHRTLIFLDSDAATAIMSFATFWTLMADDIRVAAEVGMQHDTNFLVVTAACFLLFLGEIVLSLFVRARYYRSIYFVFDVIATTTLLLEIQPLFDTSRGISPEAAIFAEASRTARLVRVVRLLRLVRLVKLAKIVNARRGVKAEQAGETKRAWQENPSEVGRMLQETITLQIVIGVLIMLMVFPALSLQSLKSRIDYELEAVGQLDALWRAHLDTGQQYSAHSAAAALLLADSSSFLHMVFFEAFDGTVLVSNLTAMPPVIRAVEYELVSAGERCASAGVCSSGGFVIKVDLIYQARFALGLLWFVIFLLGAGVVVFGQVSMRYCIAPIEKLFAIVNTFSNDPMKRLESFGDDANEELNELEQSIRKVAKLLQVGIGLAGSETIARVLRSTGDIDPIAMGRKVNCLFGFCDIRQFTDATECLQEEVMVFTNSVGHIVHHAVHDCGGFANKNIGDAFLVAWTSDELERCIKRAESLARDQLTSCTTPATSKLELALREKWVPTVGDKAMASFIRLTVCVRGATHITRLVQNPALQRRLPGFTVRLGCGLHVGWAIEGALGSQKKIDATYLSPATNIAMSLEGATKQYGNLLLISEQAYKLFSPYVRVRVRRIDRVFATPGAAPFDLYTYDCPTSLSVHPDDAEESAGLEHVFDFPLAITPQFRAVFDAGLSRYLEVRRVRLAGSCACLPWSRLGDHLPLSSEHLILSSLPRLLHCCAACCTQGAWDEAKTMLEQANALLVEQAQVRPTISMLRSFVRRNRASDFGLSFDQCRMSSHCPRAHVC